MGTTIKMGLSVELNGRSESSLKTTLSVQAYDKIQVEVPAAQDSNNPGEMTVEVQPGDAKEVKFLLLTATDYKNLKYWVQGDGGTPSNDGIELDEPQAYVGAGMIGLFGVAPRTLKFENRKEASVSVEILVGRNAESTGTGNGGNGNGS